LTKIIAESIRDTLWKTKTKGRETWTCWCRAWM